MIIENIEHSDDTTLELIFKELCNTVEYLDLEWSEESSLSVNPKGALAGIETYGIEPKVIDIGVLGGPNLDPFDAFGIGKASLEAFRGYTLPESLVPIYFDPLDVKNYQTVDGGSTGNLQDVAKVADSALLMENTNAVDNFNNANTGFVVMGDLGGGQNRYPRH